MINNCIHVAVIDDGVNANLYDINLKYDVIVNDDLNILPYKICDFKKKTHGTICAAIINYNLKCDVVMSSIKILGDMMTGTIDKLYAALDWCITHKVDVASISLGSNFFYDYPSMRKKVNDIYFKGLIMVCADSNNSYITYPASLSNVIGVKCDRENCISVGEYMSNKHIVDGIDFVAFSKYELTGRDESTFYCNSSNSYATPSITARIANIMSEMKKQDNKMFDIEKIRTHLYRKIDYEETKIRFYSCYNNPDWISKAIAFYVGEPVINDVPYYFNCKQNIFVADQNILFKKIKANIENDLDTIIIYSRKLLYKDIVNNVTELIKRKDMSLLYADEENLQYNNNICTKHWYPAYLRLKDMNYTFSREKKIDVPYIFIYGNDKNYVLKMLYEYYSLFYARGYNTYISTNSVRGIFYDFDYIPITEYMNEKNNVKSYISEMINIRRADVYVNGLVLENLIDINEYIDINIDVEINLEKNNRNIYSFTIKIEDVNLTVENKDFKSAVKKTFDYIMEMFTDK